MKIEEAFIQYKKDILYWQKRFELSHWKLNIDLNPLGKVCFSRVAANPVQCVADIEMNKEILERYLTKEEVDRCAKHEMIHILIRKLRMMADSRFVTPNDVNDADEEIAKKLDQIIK